MRPVVVQRVEPHHAGLVHPAADEVLVATADADAAVLGLVAALATVRRVTVDVDDPAAARLLLAAGASRLVDRHGALAELAAGTGAGIVLTAPPELATPDEAVVFLLAAAARAGASGVDDVSLDPALGSRSPAADLALLARLDDLVAGGLPVVVAPAPAPLLAALAAASDDRARSPGLPGLPLPLDLEHTADVSPVPGDAPDVAAVFVAWAVRAGASALVVEAPAVELAARLADRLAVPA